MTPDVLHGQHGAQYHLGTTLGEGSYGLVYLCNCDDGGGQVVVKQVRISGLSQQEQVDAINEVKVMQDLDHLNIVRYIECIQQDGCLYIVMEYCRYGDLSELIANRAKASKPFTEQEIMFWFVQLALALWQLHSKGILHRDLKSQNVFIAEGAILKLGDFGIARVLNSDTELVKTAIGTPYYLSPEIVLDKPYNRKSDCWALGCVLYELVSLRRAFDGGSLPALVVKILRGRYPPLPSRYSVQLRGLVDALLQQDPQARPSIDAILRMPYVKTHLARYAHHVMKLTNTPKIVGVSTHTSSTPPAAGGNAEQLDAAAKAEDIPTSSSTLENKAACHVVAEADTAAALQPQSSGSDVDATAACFELNSSSSGAMGASFASSLGTSCSQSSCSSSAKSAEAEHSASSLSEDTHSGSMDAEQKAEEHDMACDGSATEGVGSKQQKRGLLGTGWLDRQQAALQQLQAEMAALSGGKLPPPSCPDRAGAALQDEGSAVWSVPEGQPKQQLSPCKVLAPTITPEGQHQATAQKGNAIRQQPSSHNKSPSRSKLAGGGAGNAAARRAVALCPADAVRRQRAAWKQQQAKEAAEEATKRAARAAELAAAAQERAAQQAKQQQDSASAAAAHRQHMKAVQARIPKEQLAEIGAAFRQRLAEQLDAVGGDTASIGEDASSNKVSQGSALVLQESAGGQALLIAPDDNEAAPAVQRPKISGCGSSSGIKPEGSRGVSSIGGCVGISAFSTASVSRRSTPEKQRREGPDKLQSAEKPWKACKRKSGRSIEPDIEIFCPYGTTFEDSDEAQKVQQMQQAAELTLACGLQPVRTGPVLAAAASDADGADHCGSPQMRRVLTQIQTALAAGADAVPPARGAGESAAFAAGSIGCSQPDAFELPPEVIVCPAAPVFKFPASKSCMPGHHQGQVLGQGQLPSAAAAGLPDEALLGERIEALRCSLEASLGEDVMLLAHRYVEAMQQAPTADCDVEEAGTGINSVAMGPSYEELLGELLGPEKVHLVHQIHKLLLLESQAFMQ